MREAYAVPLTLAVHFWTATRMGARERRDWTMRLRTRSVLNRQTADLPLALGSTCHIEGRQVFAGAKPAHERSIGIVQAFFRDP
jgi:hypothetical protein